jgi:hypothetical protein
MWRQLRRRNGNRRRLILNRRINIPWIPWPTSTKPPTISSLLTKPFLKEKPTLLPKYLKRQNKTHKEWPITNTLKLKIILSKTWDCSTTIPSLTTSISKDNIKKRKKCKVKTERYWTIIRVIMWSRREKQDRAKAVTVRRARARIKSLDHRRQVRTWSIIVKTTIMIKFIGKLVSDREKTKFIRIIHKVKNKKATVLIIYMAVGKANPLPTKMKPWFQLSLLAKSGVKMKPEGEAFMIWVLKYRLIIMPLRKSVEAMAWELQTTASNHMKKTIEQGLEDLKALFRVEP